MPINATMLRAMNDPTDGMLVVPAGVNVDDVGNPKWAGSDVGKSLKHTITNWSSHAKDPLFRKAKMDLTDISQEGVGDCWYIAAMVAILNLPNGSTLIKKTMVDVGGGKVIVRLFDGTQTPHYLRVDKSVLWDSGFGKKHVSGLGKTGLWPAILEKAAACFTKASGHKVCDPATPNYLNLEGGHCEEAFGMLLGIPAAKIPSKNLQEVGAMHGKVTANDHLSQLFKSGNWRGRPETDKANMDALNAVFGFKSMSVVQWQGIMAQLGKDKSPLVFMGSGDDLRVGTAGTWADFYRLLSMPGVSKLPPDVTAKVGQYAKAQGINGAGAIGSGAYSPGMTSMFNQVKAKCQANCPVGFGTVKHVGVVQGRGKSAGEEISRGMVGQHAYAVLGTFEETVGGKRKWLKVANPWNAYGRKYVDTSAPTLTATDQSAGAFWIELGDLASVIDDVYYCDAPGDGR